MPRAQRDLADLYVAINAERSDAAFHWFNELERAIFTLEEYATRCPFAPESQALRHLLYGKRPHIYRVIYRVLEKQKEVEILHIRHGARQPFSSEDLS
jgi:plasmid stabilization system protein ParE